MATAEDFGRELSLARMQAGLTVRDVARASGIPVSTAGDYFAGRHLPSPAQAGTLVKILGCCGLTGEAEVSAWTDAFLRARRAPGRRRADVPPPYPGLAAFQPEDAAWFFGRDELAHLLLQAAVAADAPPVPLIVIGPSGSGKSSLLRAGLVPRLTAGCPGRPVSLFTPGAAPTASLAAQLGKVPPGVSPVLIVDQFEEVFAACPDEAERHDFITALTELSGHALVVAGMRADFYGHAIRYPVLARSLQHRQVVVAPMTQQQLRAAIVEPARRARLTLEPGLAELVLRDFAPAGTGSGPDAQGHEAGALPFLSHALRMTWERSRGGRLTVAGYQASGGIRDAIGQTAEAAYTALGPAERAAARQLFLRLVQVAGDYRVTRARVPLAELDAAIGDATGDGLGPGDGLGAGDGAAAGGGLLARFVAARLVTLDADTAEITHEALLSAWPRLRRWIEADMEGARTRRNLTSAAHDWQRAGRDDALLLRGAPLAVAAEWAGDEANRRSLGSLTRDFLDAGVAHEQARQAAERRGERRLRRLVAALTAAVLMAVTLAGYAFGQRQDAAAARNQADSREMAVEAGQLRGEDPSLAAQLGLAAYRVAPTRSALAGLLASTASPAAARVQDSAGVVESVAFAARRRLLAVAAADGTLRLWHVPRPGATAPAGGPLTGLPRSSSLFTTAVSPDGRLLAAGGAGGVLRLWDVSRPAHPVQLGTPPGASASTVYSVAFSPDGRLLAAGGADGQVRLWQVGAGGRLTAAAHPLTGAGGYVEAVAFSPGGRILAAASANGSVRLWSLAGPARRLPLGRPLGRALTGPAGIADTVAFSPDGRLLAVGDRDHSVWLWNVADPARPVRVRPPLTNATDWVNAVAFSPGGRILAAATSGNQVLLWDPATGALLATLPEPQPVTSLVWDGARVLIAGAADGTVRLWQVPPPVLQASGPVNQVAYAPGGKLLAVAGQDLQTWYTGGRLPAGRARVPGAFPNSVAFAPHAAVLAAGYSDGKIRRWRLGPGGGLSPLGRPVTGSSTGLTEFVAFRPDGAVLASAGDDGTVRLWDVAAGRQPRLLARIRDAHTYVFSVAFSPDGRTLAAASADNLTRLWDVADPAHPRLLGRPLAGPASYAYSVAFSPSGQVLAVGSADKTIRLWNVADPGHPRPLGPPLTGPDAYVYSVAFSRDGRMLAGGATDGKIWLWRVADPARPHLIVSLSDTASVTTHIYTVAFSPSGTLAAGSSDGQVRLWSISPTAAVAATCATVAQPLTRAEWAAYAPGRRYQPPCAH